MLEPDLAAYIAKNFRIDPRYIAARCDMIVMEERVGRLEIAIMPITCKPIFVTVHVPSYERPYAVPYRYNEKSMHVKLRGTGFDFTMIETSDERMVFNMIRNIVRRNEEANIVDENGFQVLVRGLGALAHTKDLMKLHRATHNGYNTRKRSAWVCRFLNYRKPTKYTRMVADMVESIHPYTDVTYLEYKGSGSPIILRPFAHVSAEMYEFGFITTVPSYGTVQLNGGLELIPNREELNDE